MKRLIASIVLLVIFSTYLLSCEKDDLCADGTMTTPSLFIEFYQKNDPNVPKSVNIKFMADGSEKMDSIVNKTNMKLPLRVDANFTKWYVRYDQVTGSGTLSNTDTLTFNYQTKTTYVSRACGYKTTFLLDKDTEKDNATNPSEINKWIANFIVLNNNIEDESKAHIKIYL